MKVTVVLMVIAVVLSISPHGHDGAISSEKLCEQIRLHQREVLVMGARGQTQEDSHFYILVKGGYMFKVPLANLRVNATNKTTSVTIDRDYIRADTFFNVPQDQFSQKYAFFLISNQQKDAFLGRVLFSEEQRINIFQLNNLNTGALSIQDYPQNRKFAIRVLANVGIDSSLVYDCEKIHNRLFRRCTLEIDAKDELKVRENPYMEKMMLLSGTTSIATAFYLQDNSMNGANGGYYYFLDIYGLLTVSRRKSASDFATTEEKLKDLHNDRFEVQLSSFVMCNIKQTSTTSIKPQTIYPPAKAPTSYSIYWIVALCSGITVGLGGLAICLYRAWKKKKKAKRKDRKKNDRRNMSNISSNVSSNPGSSFVNSSCGSSCSDTSFYLSSNVSSNVSSTVSSDASSNVNAANSSPSTSSSSIASKASTFLQSVKSSITSVLKGKQSNQAKTVAKAKNSKVKPKKKPKTPK